MYIDCESSPRERVPFIQRAGGVLADGFVAIQSGVSTNDAFQVMYMYPALLQ